MPSRVWGLPVAGIDCFDVPSWSLLNLLPALYLLLLGCLLGLLLKFLGEPLPRPVAAAMGAVVLLLLGPVLVGGEILLPLDNLRGSPPFQLLEPTEPHGNSLQGDLVQLILPLQLEVRRDLAEGRWPLWNRSFGAGMPLLTDPQAQPFQPFTLLALPLRVEEGAAVTAGLRVLFALVFSFAFLRRLGLREGPALVGSFAFGLGGFVVLWLGWPLANTAAWLPAVLFGVQGCVAQGRRRDEVFLLAALLGLLLCGHPETLFFSLIFIGAMTAELLWRLGGARWEVLGRLGAVASLTMLLSAPVLLPTLQYLPLTWRAATAGLVEGVAEDPGSLEPEGGKAGEAGFLSQLAQAWVPIAAPNAFGNDRYVHYWGRRNVNEDASAFVGTTTLLLVILGLWSGRGSRRPGEVTALLAAGLVLAILTLPALGVSGFLGPLHGGQRLRLILAFCLALAATCSLDRIGENGLGRWPLAVAGLLLGALVAGAYLGFPSPAGEEVLRVLRIGWLHWQGRMLVAGILLLAFAPRRRWMPLLAAALVAGELLLAFGGANPPMPRRLAFPSPPPLAHAMGEAGVEPEEPRQRIVGLAEALPPNLATVYGLADLRIYNPMEPAAYADLVAPVLEQPRGNVPRTSVADHPLYDLLGVRFVLTAPGIDLPPPLELVVDDPSGRLYRRPEAKPLLFFAGDPAKGTASVEQIRWRGAGVRARASGSEDALLASRILTPAPEAGWRLLVDGRPHALRLANGPLLAARLPAGDHPLAFLYRPPGLLGGSFLAALGFCGAFFRWWRLRALESPE